MLDMYDFENDIWLCHSFGGKCYNFTAFVSVNKLVSGNRTRDHSQKMISVCQMLSFNLHIIFLNT